MKKLLIGISLLLITIFFIIISTIVWTINIQQKEARSITICNNLKMANRLSQSYTCMNSNSMPDFMPILFPFKTMNIDIDYVRDGMKDYETLYDDDIWCGGPSNQDKCFRIRYNLTGGRYFIESADFVFRNGRLTNITYSD